jgi:hypothetical protein
MMPPADLVRTCGLGFLSQSLIHPANVDLELRDATAGRTCAGSRARAPLTIRLCPMNPRMVQQAGLTFRCTSTSRRRRWRDCNQSERGG